jgi:DNA-binding NtrC family response regulator
MEIKPVILLVDDEEKLRGLLKRLISLEGYEIKDTGSLSGARHLLSTGTIDILLCDVRLQDGNGVDFTKEVKAAYPHVEVILLTAYGNIPDGVQAIKNGAYDYLVKGDDNGKILPLLSHLSAHLSSHKQIQHIDKKTSRICDFTNIIGKSRQLKTAIQLAEKVAATDTAVLLTGETGTGKEVFAQAIHYNSRRSEQHFTALNCSAFSRELLESELFGHKAGAFTGATKDKKGLVEDTRGGTLFLDEIGEMSPELQPKLLRLLENGTYFRVGDTKEQKSDIRIIAATNRNLKHEIEHGSFRGDLYFRIAIFTIDLAPLRERPEDIMPLVLYYLDVYSKKTNKTITAVTKEAEAALVTHNWPGNIRELKNTIERGVILEDTSILTLSSISADVLGRAASADKANLQLNVVEKIHIQKVLAYTHGNKSEAARLMGIGLATLYRKLEEYSLK